MSIIAPSQAYAVVLAGGSGTRFWPKSRQTYPKQLCHIGDPDYTMIEKTLRRIDGFIPPERRIIVTHRDQVAKTKEIVGQACAHYIAEPEARNTAAALALAALEIRSLHKSSDAPIMVSLHADHIIENEEAFRQDLLHAIEVANEGFLTLVGIKPTEPATGFGYLESGETLNTSFPAYRVASFREKPKVEVAREYLQRGQFYWNSGYFIWRIDTLLNELREHLPGTLHQLETLQSEQKKLFSQIEPNSYASVYASLPKIAIDNAVLEVSDKVAFVPSHFGWHDVGSWDALDHCTDADKDENRVQGDAILIDCKNVTVDASSLFVGCIGLEDIVVVQTKDAILVCPKSRAQDVKLMVEHLQAKSRKELL